MPVMRLHALLGKLIGKFQGAEQIVRIGDRQRRHRVRRRKLGERRHVHAPFAQRIGAVNMKMHEAGTPGNRGGIHAVIGVRARHHRCVRFAQAAIYPRGPGLRDSPSSFEQVSARSETRRL